MCSLFFHPLLYLVDSAFSISSHFTFLVMASWPRFVLNSTQPHFELSELGCVLFKGAALAAESLEKFAILLVLSTFIFNFFYFDD